MRAPPAVADIRGTPSVLARAADCVRRGWRITRRAPGQYLLVVGLFSAPSLVAGLLAASVPEPALWQRVAVLTLPWITVVLGAVTIMMLVMAHAGGQATGLGAATWHGLTWTPRYLWTNAHTSLLFWLPITALLETRTWLLGTLRGGGTESEGTASAIVAAVSGVAIAAVAVAIHTRTLLAPFLAVHGDLPGTLAALEAWRLSGRHFALCLGTFALGTLPVALPLGLLVLATLPWLLALGVPTEALAAAAPNLTWIGIQSVRPLLIPALYVLYADLWHAELARREQEGAPPTPFLARHLLRLTRPLPHVGRAGLEAASGRAERTQPGRGYLATQAASAAKRGGGTDWPSA